MNFNKDDPELETVLRQKWEDWLGACISNTPDQGLRVLSPNWDRSRTPIPNSPNSNHRFDQRTKPRAYSTPLKPDKSLDVKLLQIEVEM